MAEPARVPPELSGVPETALWNLCHRARAASASPPLLDDPQAAALVARLDYPFARFETGHAAAVQWHAVRVRSVDAAVRAYLLEQPEATVVALGEGLDTQFWRVDTGTLTWVGVDLPEIVELRRRLLPADERVRLIAGSALDAAWLDELGELSPTLVVAQGLFMYFTADEVVELVGGCASRLPGGRLVFDAVPQQMIKARERWTRPDDGYRPPAWTWGVTDTDLRRISALPGVSAVRRVPPVRGRGLVFGALLPVLRRLPPLRGVLPEFPVYQLTFGR